MGYTLLLCYSKKYFKALGQDFPVSSDVSKDQPYPSSCKWIKHFWSRLFEKRCLERSTLYYLSSCKWIKRSTYSQEYCMIEFRCVVTVSTPAVWLARENIKRLTPRPCIDVEYSHGVVYIEEECTTSVFH